MKKLFLIYCIIAAGGFFLSAQSEEDLFGSSEDDLFGGEDALFEEQESSDTAMADLLLVDDEVVRIGGSYNLGFSTGASFSPETIADVDDLEWDFTPDLSASLFLDARPDSDIRVFAKAEVEYPFTVSEDDTSTPYEDESRDFDDIVYIKELFSDFNINETLFFRAGKQTANWGVGYYFSPADLLNLTEIDPEDPEAELEGPLSVKMHLPVESHNFYLYTAVPEDIEDPSDLAFAPKAELVFGSTEVGLGAYYRYEQSPAAMVTFTTALWDFDVFGEAVVQYGSDKTFVEETGGIYLLVTYDDQLFFSATIGASYSWSAEESDFSISASGQYYFNGEGYSDPTILTSASGSAFVGASMASEDLSVSDLMNRSMHYGAASVSVTPVEDLSFSVFWLGNFSDFSGMIRPGLTWQATDYISLGINIPWNYGDEGDEYSPDGDNLSFALEVSLGGTSF